MVRCFAWWPCGLTLLVCAGINLWFTDAVQQALGFHQVSQARTAKSLAIDPAAFIDRPVPMPDDVLELMSGNVAHHSQDATTAVDASEPSSLPAELPTLAVMTAPTEQQHGNSEDAIRALEMAKSKRR